MKNPFLPSVVLPLMLFILLLASSCNDSGEDVTAPNAPVPNDFYWDKVGNLLFTVTFDSDSVYSTRCFIIQGSVNSCGIAIFTAYTFRNEEFSRFKKIEVHNYHEPGAVFWGRVYRNTVNVFTGCITSAVYEDGKVKFVTETDTVSFQIGTSDYYNLYERCLAEP